VYVFDTSSFRVLRNYYPGTFPSFWLLFDAFVKDGEVISVREVRNELRQQLGDGWLNDWINEHRELFPIPGQQETAFVSEIFAVPHFQFLISQQQRLKGNPVADPFVIAAARVNQATVVTEEVFKPNAAKIPNVCEHFHIECIDLEKFLAINAWQF
jgi:Domain of unknown function (DUF4411)